MQDSTTTPAITSAFITATGAEMRSTLEAQSPLNFASTSQRIGELDVQLVRHGTTWCLFLADLSPVPQTVRDRWATAVSAPSVEWCQTNDGGSTWCTWEELRS